MTDAANRKLDVDDDHAEDIARDDPLFELSQIIGYTPNAEGGNKARGKEPEQMDLEDALVSELEGEADDYEAEPGSEPAVDEISDEPEAPLPTEAVAPRSGADDTASADTPEDTVAEADGGDSGQGDVLENELLALLGDLGEEERVKPYSGSAEAPSVSEDRPVEKKGAVPQEVEQPSEPDEDFPGFERPSPGELAASSAGSGAADRPAKAGESAETFDFDDAAILDEFEDALNNDLAFSLDDPGDADGSPESEADPASAGPLTGTTGQPELFSGEPDQESRTAPVLETAEMPAGDIETVAPLDLPDLPVLEEKRTQTADIERELDAALAGFDQYDEAPVEEESASPQEEAPAEMASGETDFDLDAFEDGLARDLEFVNHDLQADGVDAYNPEVEAAASGSEHPEMQQQKSRRGLTIAAVVGGIAILGAIGAFGLVSGGGETDSGPVLVKADPDPVKIVPEDPGGKQVPNQDRAVYGEVDGQAAPVPTQETLVSTSEEPIDLRASETVSLPAGVSESGKVEDRLLPEESSEAAGQPAGDAPVLAPRRVRTVVVKPDGSFVAQPPASEQQTPVGTSSAVETAEQSDSSTLSVSPEASGTARPEAAGSQEVRAVDLASAPDSSGTVAPDGPVAGGTAVQNEAVAAEEPVARDAAAINADQTPTDTALASAAEIESPVAVETATNVAGTAAAEAETGGTQASVTQPITPPRVIPDRPSDSPVDVARPEGAQVAAAPRQVRQPAESVTPPPAVPASEYTVQIASLPSAELAQSTAERLSQRYSELLGGRSISIVRAEIEGRGTFHRVRVSAAGRNDAVALCERYKRAGGSCFVAR